MRENVPAHPHTPHFRGRDFVPHALSRDFPFELSEREQYV